MLLFGFPAGWARLISVKLTQCEKVCTQRISSDVLDLSSLINCLQFSWALCPGWHLHLRSHFGFPKNGSILVRLLPVGAAWLGQLVLFWCKLSEPGAAFKDTWA